MNREKMAAPQENDKAREITMVKLPKFAIDNNNKIIEITSENNVDKHICVGCRSLTVLHRSKIPPPKPHQKGKQNQPTKIPPPNTRKTPCPIATEMGEELTTFDRGAKTGAPTAVVYRNWSSSPAIHHHQKPRTNNPLHFQWPEH
jgi:hypothetical protein